MAAETLSLQGNRQFVVPVLLGECILLPLA
jgi:hypothetical protein